MIEPYRTAVALLLYKQRSGSGQITPPNGALGYGSDAAMADGYTYINMLGKVIADGDAFELASTLCGLMFAELMETAGDDSDLVDRHLSELALDYAADEEYDDDDEPKGEQHVHRCVCARGDVTWRATP